MNEICSRCIHWKPDETIPREQIKKQIGKGLVGGSIAPHQQNYRYGKCQAAFPPIGTLGSMHCRVLKLDNTPAFEEKTI